MNLKTYLFLLALCSSARTILPMHQQSDSDTDSWVEQKNEEQLENVFAELVQAENLHDVLVQEPSLVLQHDESGQTLLHHAIAMDQPTSVTTLIDAGAEVNAVDNDGSTALHLLADIEDTREDAKERQIAMARDLINHGAAFATKDNKRRTPAQIARNHGNESLAEAIERPASRQE